MNNQLSSSNTARRGPQTEFNQRAVLTPEEKLEAMVKAMPEADRMAYQYLIDEQKAARETFTARLDEERPALLAKAYQDAFVKVTAPRKDHDFKGAARPVSFYREKAQGIAAQEIQRQEALKTDRFDARQFEIRYSLAKHTTERIAARNATRGVARGVFNNAGKDKSGKAPDMER